MGDLGCQKGKIALTLVGTGESLNALEQIKGICHLRTITCQDTDISPRTLKLDMAPHTKN